MAEEAVVEEEFHLSESQVNGIKYDLNHFRMAFKAYDKESKGEIPSSLLGTVMKNLGHNLKPDQLQEAIEAVDSDGSGWIDFDEFLALMAKKTKEAQDEQELREAFRVFDSKNKGQIETGDLKVIFKALDPDMSDDEIDAIITEVDEDGSGTLDFEEFLKLMTG